MTDRQIIVSTTVAVPPLTWAPVPGQVRHQEHREDDQHAERQRWGQIWFVSSWSEQVMWTHWSCNLSNNLSVITSLHYTLLLVADSLQIIRSDHHLCILYLISDNKIFYNNSSLVYLYSTLIISQRQRLANSSQGFKSIKTF